MIFLNFFFLKNPVVDLNNLWPESNRSLLHIIIQNLPDSVSVNQNKNINFKNGEKEAMLEDWLEEMNMNSVHLKESETDKYLQEVRKQCKSSVNESIDTLPLLSEMDIDDLFKIEEIEECNEKSDIQKEIQIITTLPPLVTKKDNKTNVSRKRAKSKSPVSKKPPSKSPAAKKTSCNKNEQEINVSNKSKFTPMKLNKSRSPKHEKPVIEENIETWIQKDVEKVKRNRLEFSELIGEWHIVHLL